MYLFCTSYHDSNTVSWCFGEDLKPLVLLSQGCCYKQEWDSGTNYSGSSGLQDVAKKCAWTSPIEGVKDLETFIDVKWNKSLETTLIQSVNRVFGIKTDEFDNEIYKS